ncbi:unnamed protein product, partial [Meganyctiphanes norvegica]
MWLPCRPLLSRCGGDTLGGETIGDVRRSMGVFGRPLTLLLLLVALLCPHHTTATFNLYLTKPEVKRTLGLDAELYYVREGVLNEYALMYRVLIPADVHSLYFTWEATIRKPIKYSMRVSLEETEDGESQPAMTIPFVNISMTGSVPVVTETFRLDLPCTGHRSAEVSINLNINVTSPRPKNPPTSVHIMRRKVCLKGQSAELFAHHIAIPSEHEVETNKPISLVYYIIAALGGLVLVISIILFAVFFRRWRYKKQEHTILSSDMSSSKSGEPMIGVSNSLLRSSSPNSYAYALPSSYTLNSYASLKKHTSLLTPVSNAPCPVSDPSVYLNGSEYSRDSMNNESCDMSKDGSRDTCHSSSSLNRSEVIVDPSTAELHERFRHMEVERRRVCLTSIVHEGSFSRVYRGKIQRDHPEQDQQVLIKTVSEAASPEEINELLHEGTHLFNLYHCNILTMVGISFADNSSPFILYPFHGYKSLKLYLQEHRGSYLQANELGNFAAQAAQGLAFLHANNVLHGDIASRNCVVSEKMQIRLCDSALSQDLFSGDYEVLPGDQQPRPVKWMAYETITDHIMSTATDVWSYGVLLWELTTLASQPYVEVATCEMAEYLRDGYRLVQPLNCPDDIYKVMAFCWAINSHDRPPAKLILDYLAAFSLQLHSFI